MVVETTQDVPASNVIQNPHTHTPRWERHLPKTFVISSNDAYSLRLKIGLQTTDTGECFAVNALLNSGATNLFIDQDYVTCNRINTRPGSHPWDHAIKLTQDAKPQSCKIYPISLTEQEQLDVFLKENLESGRIHPSKSPMASPFFFIKKKDGSLRPVQDYQALNAMTVKNRYPIPLVSDLVNQLHGARYFTKLDVCWGYNNVRIREGDEWKVAFRTNRGLFEPLVMFFGLTNLPATFQMMMNDIFRDLISEGVVCVYLDDILIFTRMLEEHRKITWLVLQ
ncbi:hypothetical protein AX17_006819 [Amanita inopinata Kibby_2008]|nr:hypothetical protein AX17_006819 [Amanita inopinata Kibby_2008]